MDEEKVHSTNTREETDRKCPACGGTMDFDPATGGLHCPYCEYREEIHNDQVAREQDFETAEQTGSFNWGAEKKTVTCKACGAVSVYDELQIADECPYCGSNQVMEEAGADSMAPGGVVPFKVTVQQATGRFRGWLKKRFFCPRKAKKSAQADRFTGIYLPCWSFDASTSTTYTGMYGVPHTYRDSKGNTHTKIDWFPTSGQLNLFVDDHLEPASGRHDPKVLQDLEPYDTGRSLAYKPEYVAGFVAERYSVGLKDAWKRAKERIYAWLKGQVERKIEADHHTGHAQVNQMSTIYADVKYKYLLLPVWMSAFSYKGKVYQFFVNGETGKVAGKTPVSALRVALTVLAALVILAALSWLWMHAQF